MLLELLKESISQALLEAQARKLLPSAELPLPELERSRDFLKSDFSCGIALKLAAKFQSSPRIILERIAPLLSKRLNGLLSFDLAENAYLNFRFSNSALSDLLKDVLCRGAEYGSNREGLNKSLRIIMPAALNERSNIRMTSLAFSLNRMLHFCSYDVIELTRSGQAEDKLFSVAPKQEFERTLILYSLEEQENIRQLYQKLADNSADHAARYELILVQNFRFGDPGFSCKDELLQQLSSDFYTHNSLIYALSLLNSKDFGALDVFRLKQFGFENPFFPLFDAAARLMRLTDELQEQAMDFELFELQDAALNVDSMRRWLIEFEQGAFHFESAFDLNDVQNQKLRDLFLRLSLFPQCVKEALYLRRPGKIIQYAEFLLEELSFLNARCRVLDQKPERFRARFLLLLACKQVLRNALSLLPFKDFP
ncbi:MAG: hypothetical protein K2X27_23115 [Candidatus Obscuribacterales bacterium]|nr:hypothetical protein [Candidatus Obscuribacterales bacterium]